MAAFILAPVCRSRLMWRVRRVFQQNELASNVYDWICKQWTSISYYWLVYLLQLQRGNKGADRNKKKQMVGKGLNQAVGVRSRFEIETLFMLRPGSDADLFMSRTEFIELSTWKVRPPNQLGTPLSIWNAQPFFTPSPAGNFDCGTTLERLWFRRRTFHVPNLMHKFL